MEQTTTKRWTEEFLAKKSLETDPAAEALIQGIALSQNFNGLRDLFVSLNTNDDTANNAGLPASILKDTTTVQIEETEFKFGTITQGDKVEHIFKLKNTGTRPLIIANAWGSCGCTVPEYPKDPIAPGTEAQVKVTFNSTGKKGEQHKSVTMQMNTIRHNEEVFLSGTVTPKEEKK